MRAKIIIISILLIALISGCVDSRVNGLYVDEKDPGITLKFMDDGKVLDTGKDDHGSSTSTMADYKIDGDNVIVTWFGMAFVLKIQDNGKTLVSTDGITYRKVNS